MVAYVAPKPRGERSNNMAELSSKSGGHSVQRCAHVMFAVEPIYQVKLLSAIRGGIYVPLDCALCMADQVLRRPRYHPSISTGDQQG